MDIGRLIGSKLKALNKEYFGQMYPGLAGILAFNLVSRKQIYQLNSAHRHRPKSTDILAFPSTLSSAQHQSALKEQFLNAKIRGRSWPIPFGQLVICPHVIERRMRGLKSPRLRELRVTRLLVHGFVHLAHLDHHTRREFKVMRSLESDLFKRIL